MNLPTLSWTFLGQQTATWPRQSLKDHPVRTSHLWISWTDKLSQTNEPPKTTLRRQTIWGDSWGSCAAVVMSSSPYASSSQETNIFRRNPRGSSHKSMCRIQGILRRSVRRSSGSSQYPREMTRPKSYKRKTIEIRTDSKTCCIKWRPWA